MQKSIYLENKQYKKKSNVKSIKSLIGIALKDIKSSKTPETITWIWEMWPSIVSAQMAQHSQPQLFDVQKKELLVQVSNSSFRLDFRFNGKEILEKLNAQLEGVEIETIRTRVGTVASPAP